MAFFSLAALRMILDTETDADSPGSEELLSQIRENFEALLMLLLDTGITTTCTGISETVFTDSGSPFASVAVGMTLLITSGTAKGNTYTIDATNNTTTVTCTGDTLQSDGVAATDTAKVLFDLKVNADGHDHDGVNSPQVALLPTGIVDQTAIAASAVGQGELKTSQSAATQTTPTVINTLPGGEYGFFPRIKNSTAGNALTIEIQDGLLGQSYITNVTIQGNFNSGTCSVQQRYVTASGEAYWVFILREVGTGNILCTWCAPDHPCYGNGGDPAEMEHPFGDWDPVTGLKTYISPDPSSPKYGPDLVHNAELIVCNPTKSQVKKMQKEVKKDRRHLDIIDILLRDYDIDEATDEDYPDIDVTLDLDEDIDTGKFTIIKGKVPKPSYVKCHKLKKKGL